MTDDETPYPGTRADDQRARTVAEGFRSLFRNVLYEDMPENVPTACTLAGLDGADMIASDEFRHKERLLVLFENPDELYVASGEQIFSYVSNRNPWEDYDLCIFDEAMTWCVGVTHDDKIILAKRES